MLVFMRYLPVVVVSVLLTVVCRRMSMVLDTSVSVLGKSVEWFSVLRSFLVGFSVSWSVLSLILVDFSVRGSVLSLIVVDFSVVTVVCDVVLKTEVEISLKQVCVNVTPPTPPVPEILNSLQ